MAKAELKRVEELIKTCGLYKTKAKDLKGIGQMLINDYGGQVPDTIEELTNLLNKYLKYKGEEYNNSSNSA